MSFFKKGRSVAMNGRPTCSLKFFTWFRFKFFRSKGGSYGLLGFWKDKPGWEVDAAILELVVIEFEASCEGKLR